MAHLPIKLKSRSSCASFYCQARYQNINSAIESATMLFPFYISLLFITIAQAAPRPVVNALHIRNPADDSEIIAANFDFEPEKTETSDNTETAELISPTESTEPTDTTESTGLDGQQNYGTYTTGSEGTTTNPEKLVSLGINGNAETENSDELIASTRTGSKKAPVPVQNKQPANINVPSPGSSTPEEIQAPQRGTETPAGNPSDTKPADPQNFGAGTADCRVKATLPWNDSSCAINFPQGIFPAEGFVQCQQQGSRAECRICVTAVPKHCKAYRTVEIGDAKIPAKFLIPQGQSLYSP